jgi:hypothetical protein
MPSTSTLVRPQAPLPPAPGPPTPSLAPLRPARDHRTRTTLIAIAAALALVAAVTVFLGPFGSDAGPPVRQLHAARVTADSVTLGWQAPAEVVPDGYRIERNGREIDEIAGSLLTFTDDGVRLGTRYSYAVIPLIGGDDGGEATIGVRTDVPPVSAALLAGDYRVRLRIVSAQGWESLASGKRTTESWSFAREGERLSGASSGGVWTMVLRRSGDTASGTSKESLSSCSMTPVTDTITLRLRVTAGKAIDGQWFATRFSGTFRDVAPSTTSGIWVCPGSSYTAQVQGIRR